MINNQPMTNTKDPNEARIERRERTGELIRWHLLNALQQSYALVAGLAELIKLEPAQDPICNKLLDEYYSLNTLRPIRPDFHHPSK